jgi:molybdopterin converting factor small subunit
MPHIHLKLYATLKAFLPPGAEAYAISEGATVQDVLTALNVPDDMAKLVFVDGRQADRSCSLHGGERVGIFPPVGGG